MNNQQLEHIALLAEVDDLTDRLQKWIDDEVNWDTAKRSRSLVSRLLARVQTLRFRLETPLVVATFGGTGTGKSTLVNALVGAEVSQTGRQRPTTTTPVLLIHPDLEAESLGLDLTQFHVKVVDAPVLRDIVVIDCPDPDTSEGATDGSNLAILRSIVPHCDVLLYASTQQKYKNARVIDELADVASGCRLVFVQTHADLDTDIREDWKNFLSPSYEVPEMFFVDSLKAYQEQLAHQKPSGDFGRLLDLLATELGAARRIEIRRANLIDLLQEALTICQANYERDLPSVEALMQTLADQRNQIRDTLTSQLCDELLVNRTLWERRLISSVTDMWGFTPFSAVLRLYNGIGGLVASFTFFRARTSAQMALIGAMQGARWMKSRAKEQEAETTLERLSNFGISDQQLQESRLVISGHLHSSGIEYESSDDRRDLTDLRKQAASLEDEFLGDASRVIDEVIEKLAVASSGFVTRISYDLAMMSYVVFLLLRIGYNFFWASFLAPAIGQRPEAAPLLSVDFYIPALLFLVIWSLILISLFTWRMKRGLTHQVQQFAQQMADSRLIHGLFPTLESTCRRVTADADRVRGLLEMTTSFRRNIADTSGGFLGGRRDTKATSA